MFRRQFVQCIAALGAAGAASIAAVQTKGTTTVTYVVRGFSCVTCAVGLDTMLQKRQGIAWSKSTYPDGLVHIQFDPQQITAESIKSFIAEMGFTVAEERSS